MILAVLVFFILVVFGFFGLVSVFIVGQVDVGEFEHRRGKFFAEQIAFLADPDAFDCFVDDVCDGQRLSSGFEDDDIACFQFNVRLLGCVRSLQPSRAS